MFLAPSANKQTRNHGTRVLKTPSLPINPKVIYIYNYIHNYIYDIIIYIIYLFIYLYIYKSHFEVFLRLRNTLREVKVELFDQRLTNWQIVKNFFRVSIL